MGAYLAGQHRAHSFLTLAHVGRAIFQGNVETRYSVYPAHYGIVHALCGSVTSAAAWWRQAIQYAEEQGDTGNEVAARCAHMMLASALLERSELTTSDLAALIDTLQTREEAEGRVTCISVETLDWHPTGKTWFLIGGVGELIDYAAGRMEAQ